MIFRYFEVLIKVEDMRIFSIKLQKEKHHRLKEDPSVIVIGAGSSSEAAWQIASAGIRVTLLKCVQEKSPAHHSCEFAELVCSNSFGALSSDRAAGLLQEELKLKSIVIPRLIITLSLQAGTCSR